MIDNKAQSGAVFRLLIEAIIGLAILLMIVTSLMYFNSLKVETSKAQFAETVKIAIQTPTGQVISSDELDFVKGTTFSASQFQGSFSVPAECFSFVSNLTVVTISEQTITFNQNANAKTYARCVLNDSYGCDIGCVISIGKKLEEIPMPS